MDGWLSFYRRGDYVVAVNLIGGDGPGVLAVILAVGRVSGNKFIRFPIWLFTYVFRGTPLYVQLLVFYSGMYTLEIVKGTDLLNAFFRSGLNCTVLALTLNTCAYTTEIFAGAIRSVPHGEIEAARAYGFSSFKMYRCIILAVGITYRLACLTATK
ncbi:histidine transport system permease [Salmonella bongori]|nr:histidine transport system permease [Salmonella bongori]